MHQRGTRADPITGVINQRFDLFRRLRATLRQRAHLASDHRKATALFARASGFHRRVQRQDIGLECDTVDNAGDLRDFAGAGGNFIHRVHDAVHYVAALLRRLRGIFRQAGRLTRVVGVLSHGCGELFHTGGSLFQRCGLLFST